MGSSKNHGKHAPGAQTQGTASQSEETLQMDGVRKLDDDAFAGFDVDASGYPLNGELARPDSYKATDFADIPKKKRRSALKAFFITLAILAVVVGGVYVGVATMFSTKFLPNTKIAGIDVSMKDDDEVAALLDAIPAKYQIDVVGGKFTLRASGEDVGMAIDSQKIVAAMHEDLNSWNWPWYIVEPMHDETHLLETTYDKKKCNALVKSAVKDFNKKAIAPTNATIVFDEPSQSFKITPEELGTQLASKAVQKAVRKAVAARQSSLELTDAQLKQPDVISTDKKLVESADIANGIVSAHLTLTINGDVVDEIGSDTLSGFVTIGDDYKVSLSEEDLAAWVYNLAASYTTIGTERSYTRADGKQVTVRGGSYGWEVDQETLRNQIMESIKAGEQTEIAVPCIDSANIYAGHGERDWGNRYIDVDLAEQHARFYGDDGKIIWEADFISGAADGEHETPEGVWYVIMKQSPSKLIGYTEDGKKDYEADVTYWMPFEGNSVGFHDADWQPSFGGSMYAEGYGSHGCINLSSSNAKKLYSLIEPNDVVVVHS